MATMQPIRNKKDIEKIKNYYLQRKEYMYYAIFVVGINIPIRISDLLDLKWGDIWDDSMNEFREHLAIVEMKTGKKNFLYINDNAKKALALYKKSVQSFSIDNYVFIKGRISNDHISRISVYKSLNKAGEKIGISNFGAHSLRKTFGYHAWKNNISPALIMKIYNHSSMSITQRYLGIEQDEKDVVFKKVKL